MPSSKTTEAIDMGTGYFETLSARLFIGIDLFSKVRGNDGHNESLFGHISPSYAISS